MIEIWKPVLGYEGYYIVSNIGRIASVNRYVKNKAGGMTLIKGQMLKPQTSLKGYKTITLHKRCKPKTFQIHRLVAVAFIENPLNLPQVNHKDTDKSNNTVSNLEWITNYDNMQHAIRNNCFGEFTDAQLYSVKKNLEKAVSKRKKKVVQMTFTGEIIATHDSVADAQRKTKINNSKICMCCKHKRITAGGYRWEYYQEDIT